MPKLRLMYVDDDPDIREVAELSLAMDPQIEVATASSGAEALQRAAADPPDAILLDVMMPDMDGPAVLATLREQEAPRVTPAIFVTARALPAEAERLMALGAAGVITKPFDPLKLAAEVRRILGQ